MEQNLFAWDDAEPASKPEETTVAAPTWKWWDPWPNGLSRRQCYMRQISRDRRALEECPEAEQAFFANRIVSFRKAIIEMDADGGEAQQPSATGVPRDNG